MAGPDLPPGAWEVPAGGGGGRGLPPGWVGVVSLSWENLAVMAGLFGGSLGRRENLVNPIHCDLTNIIIKQPTTPVW